jgi:hypothetical protein
MSHGYGRPWLVPEPDERPQPEPWQAPYRTGQGPLVYTRRLWLLMQTVVAGATIHQAIEAVSTTAIEHPEWDMAETKTWAAWQRSTDTPHQ